MKKGEASSISDTWLPRCGQGCCRFQDRDLGFAAKDYGGTTTLQEGARLIKQRNLSKFSLLRTWGRPDIARVSATSLTTSAAVYVSWNGGLLMGSALYEGFVGAGCD